MRIKELIMTTIITIASHDHNNDITRNHSDNQLVNFIKTECMPMFSYMAVLLILTNTHDKSK